MPEELTPDICVIGGGPAGIAVALAAANSAVPVVLVEKDAMGGSNIARGAIPSKALLVAASLYETLRRGPAIGVTGAPLQVNFARIRDHIVAVAAAVAANSSAERVVALGVRVIAAPARFVDRRTVMAGDIAIRARRFIVATGAVPAPPLIPGLPGIDYMTVDSAFDMARKPAHLLIVGAGAHGLELAQAYHRLGVDSTVLDAGPALPETDPELAAIILERLRAEGIRVRAKAKIVGVARRKGGIRVTLVEGGDEAIVDGSHLLVAVGSRPNVAGLGLEAAGIALDPAGVVVDRLLRTTNRRVYAIGDVVAGLPSVARGEYHGDRILKSILYRLPIREYAGTVPEVVFTDPALASVGLSEADARRLRPDIRILRFPFVNNDLAQIERLPAGVIKVVTTRRGRILGAAIVGSGATEMIALWSLAIANRLPIVRMAALIAPYPSRIAISRRVAESFRGPGLTPRWRRRIMEFLRKFG
jgi:pyruvate/2-oxoglutarate dehydrogenase complex dihydrolipoamide dehydrogenase (E3) component